MLGLRESHGLSGPVEGHDLPEHEEAFDPDLQRALEVDTLTLLAFITYGHRNGWLERHNPYPGAEFYDSEIYDFAE